MSDKPIDLHTELAKMYNIKLLGAALIDEPVGAYDCEALCHGNAGLVSKRTGLTCTLSYVSATSCTIFVTVWRL